jgi:hypothetical protein
VTEPDGGPVEFEVTECESCHAEIIWALTARAVRMPVDRYPVADGNVQLTATGCGLPPQARVLTVAQQFGKKGTLHRSHFGTCPDAAMWRRKR